MYYQKSKKNKKLPYSNGMVVILVYFIENWKVINISSFWKKLKSHFIVVNINRFEQNFSMSCHVIRRYAQAWNYLKRYIGKREAYKSMKTFNYIVAGWH